MQNGSICLLIQKHLEPFHFHHSRYTVVIMIFYIFLLFMKNIAANKMWPNTNLSVWLYLIFCWVDTIVFFLFCFMLNSFIGIV